jgi:hypothetical protein
MPPERDHRYELDPDLVRAYAATFIPRHDLYPLQLRDGRYASIKATLHPDLIAAHLRGFITIGAYALDTENRAKWLCLDADTHDQWQQLKDLSESLLKQHVPSYLELSRRGGHLWLFFSPLSGNDTRRLGKQLLADQHIAQLLNADGYRTKKGRPFSKDTVRDMLQNQTYLGKVKYQEYRRNADRSRSRSVPVECFDGQHEALISQALFDRCQAARHLRVAHRQATPRYTPYLLRGLIYCYSCCTSAPTEYSFPAFGKMRGQIQKSIHRYYRCRARDFDHQCDQQGVLCDLIELQVIQALKQLKPPPEWRKHITRVVSELLGEESLEQRLTEIRAAIDRMDFRWDQGFITDKHEYLEKRVRLQQELEQLTPVPEADLETAADLLENFGKHWAACKDDPEAEHRLIKLIVDRVYVQGEEVVAMTLKADYHIVLGHKANEPTAISVGSPVYTCGDDGLCTHSGHAILLPPQSNYARFLEHLLAHLPTHIAE